MQFVCIMHVKNGCVGLLACFDFVHTQVVDGKQNTPTLFAQQLMSFAILSTTPVSFADEVVQEMFNGFQVHTALQ